MRTALVIGNSDGIGLALTRALLEQGWRVTGISRSGSVVESPNYEHHVLDVCAEEYATRLAAVALGLGEITLCVYCAGIGEFLDLNDMTPEARVLRTNLLGAVITAQCVVPAMVTRGAGQFIGLSSQADRWVDGRAPSYAASKAGLSSYLEGLALACRERGVFVTNLRLGFVDTKMAKSAQKPFLLSSAQAVQRILFCIETRPMRDTYPKRMAVLLWFLGSLRSLRWLFSR